MDNSDEPNKLSSTQDEPSSTATAAAQPLPSKSYPPLEPPITSISEHEQEQEDQSKYFQICYSYDPCSIKDLHFLLLLYLLLLCTLVFGSFAFVHRNTNRHQISSFVYNTTPTTLNSISSILVKSLIWTLVKTLLLSAPFVLFVLTLLKRYDVEKGSYQNSCSDQSTPRGLTRPRRSLEYTSRSRQSPEYGRSTPTSSNTPSPTNISLNSTPFSSHSNSPDHKAPNFALMQSSNFVNMRGRTLDSMPHFLSGSSDPSEEQSYQSDLSYELMDHSKLSDASGSSTASAAELEDELRRMKVELKQILEMYNVACQEAESAKEKVREIIKWDTEKASRLAEAKHVRDAALAVVEREKSKCKAAVDIAHRAQHIAELESEKRKRAERKFQHESEEKQKAMDALARCGVRCRRYSIEEIEAATNYFSPSDKIGEGSYGPVYKGMIDHTPVAIKVLRSDISEGHKQFQQEVEVLSRMRHPNMVILLGACPEYGCLVYEHMDNGSLEDRLLRSPPLPWPSRFRIAAEVATALNFLHQTKPEPLVHRDLKPANILLDRNHIAKISDVGLARLVPPPDPSTSATQYRHTAAAGTFCYIDPEYQQTGMLGTKSDVYSLGVLLLQLVTARPPMGLTHLVGTAIEEGRFGEVLDPAVENWPLEEALSLARLALRCCELRRRDRPDLDRVVLPELERLRDVGRQVKPPARSYYMYMAEDGVSFQESTDSSQERGTSFETEPEFQSK
ncbi:protein kinase family protein [Striga hermonthica]|uniref:RING-type E3 ubiquitin transferase n=1 Tax=Striga hermonthica TaxID=68872 RepID=A0A9N7MVW5_STRHE|nr:protein kinase family protein [Striga hermonthica]